MKPLKQRGNRTDERPSTFSSHLISTSACGSTSITNNSELITETSRKNDEVDSRPSQRSAATATIQHAIDRHELKRTTLFDPSTTRSSPKLNELDSAEILSAPPSAQALAALSRDPQRSTAVTALQSISSLDPRHRNAVLSTTAQSLVP